LLDEGYANIASTFQTKSKGGRRHFTLTQGLGQRSMKEVLYRVILPCRRGFCAKEGETTLGKEKGKL